MSDGVIIEMCDNNVILSLPTTQQHFSYSLQFWLLAPRTTRCRYVLCCCVITMYNVRWHLVWYLLLPSLYSMLHSATEISLQILLSFYENLLKMHLPHRYLGKNRYKILTFRFKYPSHFSFLTDLELSKAQTDKFQIIMPEI